MKYLGIQGIVTTVKQEPLQGLLDLGGLIPWWVPVGVLVLVGGAIWASLATAKTAAKTAKWAITTPEGREVLTVASQLHPATRAAGVAIAAARR